MEKVTFSIFKKNNLPTNDRPIFLGETSLKFRDEISYSWKNLHPNIRSALIACKIKIICPHNLADYKYGSLLNILNRVPLLGFGGAFSGYYDTVNKVILIPENIRRPSLKGWNVKLNESVGRALYHEIGHALADIFNLDRNPEFRKAYWKDIVTNGVEGFFLKGDELDKVIRSPFKRIKAYLNTQIYSDNKYFMSNLSEAFAESWARANFSKSRKSSVDESFRNISSWHNTNTPSNTYGFGNCTYLVAKSQPRGPLARLLINQIKKIN